MKSIIANAVQQVSSSSKLSGFEKRKVEKASVNLQKLYDALDTQQLAADTLGRLNDLCDALSANDYERALQCQITMVTKDWDNNNEWLLAVKNIIQLGPKA